MLCINHKKTQAVGVCAGCGKGLCEECVQPLSAQTLCCGNAECQNKVVHRARSEGGTSNGFLYVLIGLAFILHHYLRMKGYEDFFLLEAGFVCVLFGVYRLFYSKTRQ